MRVRACTNPPPSGGGANCVGETQQTDSSNEMNCPQITLINHMILQQISTNNSF